MQKLQNLTIAIVDSGIGGVSILKQLLQKNICANYIYYADNENMPYGNKTKTFLKKKANEIVSYLNENIKPDIIIIACNTMSTCINQDCDNVKLMKFKEGYTYLATSLTKKNMPNLNVIQDKTLAKQIEKNIFDGDKLSKLIKSHIKNNNLLNEKHIVLGCTHYELVIDLFKENCINCEVINNSSFVIAEIVKYCEQFEMGKETNIVVKLSQKDNNLENKILKLIKG